MMHNTDMNRTDTVKTNHALHYTVCVRERERERERDSKGAGMRKLLFSLFFYTRDSSTEPGNRNHVISGKEKLKCS